MAEPVSDNKETKPVATKPKPTDVAPQAVTPEQATPQVADATIKYELIKLIMQKLLAMMESEFPAPAPTKKPVTKIDDDEVSFELNIEEISKSTDDEERLSYGIAYPAKPKTWKDSQSDWISKEEIRDMAHTWLANSQHYDIHHRVLNVSKDDAVVVESYLAPVDFTINGKEVTEGSWVVVTHYPSDEMWAKVKKGELAAYSIRGTGKRRKIN